MIIKILIRTPKGQAQKTSKKISGFIFGLKKVKIDTYFNEDDDKIVWEVEGKYKDINKIQKNVYRFHMLIDQTFSKKMVQKAINKYLKPEEKETLMEMLKNQTNIDILKPAEYSEVEKYNTGWWEKIKNKFVKV